MEPLSNNNSIAEALPDFDNPIIPEAIRVIGYILIPFQIISLIRVPWAGVTIGENASNFRWAPKHLKVLPALKILEAFGSLFTGMMSVVSLCNKFGVIGMRAMATALTPLGAVGTILQVVGAPISLWSLHEVDQQWKKFINLLGKKDSISHEPTEKELHSAFSSLVSAPDNMLEGYRNKFFGIFNGSTQKKISKIYAQFKDGALKQVAMVKTITALRSHYIQKQVQNITQIALMIIGVIGTLILMFAPTPIAPAAWGILGISGAATVGFYIYKYLQNKNFHNELKAIRNSVEVKPLPLE